jgi:hypothetical protein
MKSSRDHRQLLTVSLTGVTDIYGGTASANFSFRVLRGDVDGEADAAAVKAAAAANSPVDQTTFRLDVNADGTINNADVAQTRTRKG